ncbi:alpha/beta fold hydrolase [Occultella aeris]|uniref:N-formylmaleamate deformylase n=1 Tax=Occultella aeris TaxID=2761496 RepID=A0A7M4DS50_9MICO|nr:alpha/beta fold hydrolase [Occultella aeris]VZO40294.1 N-formylmaleamate deformylase [Occultella aeris]
MQTFTIHHHGVRVAVSRGGRGQLMVLCPGLNSTQADLHELAESLREDYDVVTFDLRGHGLSSAADDYTFEAFLSDLAAVMLDLGRLDLAAASVLVGYSLGADLAVHFASEHPDTVAALVLIDGANPVPEPLISDALLPQFRAMWEAMAAQQVSERDTSQQVRLTGQEILDLNVEVDVIRSGILDRYRRIDLPTSMIMSTSMAGTGNEGPAPRLNRAWRAGVERLLRDQPHIVTSWIDADHGLPFTHAREIARIIRSTPGSAARGGPSNAR